MKIWRIIETVMDGLVALFSIGTTTAIFFFRYEPSAHQVAFWASFAFAMFWLREFKEDLDGREGQEAQRS